VDRFATAISVAASLTLLAGYWFYNKKIAKSDIRPNATTWGLWAAASFPVVLVYFDLTGDWVKNLLPLTCAIAAIGTFVHMMIRGSFQKPNRIELEIAALDVAVILYWVACDDPFITSIFLEIDIWITFIPILQTTWNHPETEDPKPWIIWTVAYTLFTIVVLLRWEQWWDLILPVNYVVQHGLVGVFARFRRAARD
jgi:hypothetical protein